MQRPDERTRCVLDQVGQPVVRNGLAPVTQDDLRIVGLGSPDVAQRPLRGTWMRGAHTAHRDATATQT